MVKLGGIKNNKKEKWKKIGAVTVNTLLVIIFVFLILQIVFQIRYETFSVSGPSMHPTLNKQGDVVYADRFATPKKGNIVVVEDETVKPDPYIIKRVIATGNDTVNIQGKNITGEFKEVGGNMLPIYEEYVVMVNGEEINENYLTNKSPTLMKQEFERFLNYKLSLTEFKGKRPEVVAEIGITLKEDEIFILGDNREESLDSSSFGPVLLANVVGVCDFIIPYGTSSAERFFLSLGFLFVFK